MRPGDKVWYASRISQSNGPNFFEAKEVTVTEVLVTAGEGDRERPVTARIEEFGTSEQDALRRALITVNAQLREAERRVQDNKAVVALLEKKYIDTD